MKYLLLAAALLGVFGAVEKVSSGKGGGVTLTNDGTSPPPPPPPK